MQTFSQKQYRHDNKDKIKGYMTAWRLANKEHIKEHAKNYYENNKEARAENFRKWYFDNHKYAVERNKKWADENPERIKKYDLTKTLKRYGLTIERYNQLLETQKEKCAICLGISKIGRKLNIDHNHKTGEVRGLLCDKCNFALGHFKDNKEYLLRAIDYLDGK